MSSTHNLYNLYSIWCPSSALGPMWEGSGISMSWNCTWIKDESHLLCHRNKMSFDPEHEGHSPLGISPPGIVMTYSMRGGGLHMYGGLHEDYMSVKPLSAWSTGVFSGACLGLTTSSTCSISLPRLENRQMADILCPYDNPGIIDLHICMTTDSCDIDPSVCVSEITLCYNLCTALWNMLAPHQQQQVNEYLRPF